MKKTSVAIGFASLLIIGVLFGNFVQNRYFDSKPFANVFESDDEDESSADESETNCVEDPGLCATNSSEFADQDEPNLYGEEEEEEEVTPPASSCSQDTWQCNNWGPCVNISGNGQNSRTCTLSFDCPTANMPKPNETQSCELPPLSPQPPIVPTCTGESWQCSNWSACSNNSQTRQCLLRPGCGSASQSTRPQVARSCEMPAQVQETVQETQCSADFWTCGNWSECIVDTRVRTCTLASDCQQVFSPSPPEAEQCSINAGGSQSQTGQTGSGTSNTGTGQNQIIVSVDRERDADVDGIPDALDPAPGDPDLNENGILDGVDLFLDEDLTVPDEEDTAARNQEAAQIQQIQQFTGIGGGAAERTVRNTYKKKKAERRVSKIRKLGEKKYKRKIDTHTQDSNNDGISDEVEVMIGLNPSDRKKLAGMSNAELKLYRTNEEKFGKKMTISIYNGYKLSAKGFAVLATCQSNQPVTLYMIDLFGKEIPVANKTCSRNNKTVFTVKKDSMPRPGRYLVQVRRTANETAASILTARAAYEETDRSEPVLVDLLPETDVLKPIAKKIENLELAGLRNIRISAGPDRKIHVSGESDISTMVIGTFESAVYTSAMLTDVENGSFDIVSGEPLENGEHEVTIYAVRPEESVASEPITIDFTVIGTVIAAAQQRSASPETGTSTATASEGTRIILFIIGGSVLLLAGTFVFLKRRKKTPLSIS